MLLNLLCFCLRNKATQTLLEWWNSFRPKKSSSNQGLCFEPSVKTIHFVGETNQTSEGIEELRGKMWDFGGIYNQCVLIFR